MRGLSPSLKAFFHGRTGQGTCCSLFWDVLSQAIDTLSTARVLAQPWGRFAASASNRFSPGLRGSGLMTLSTYDTWMRRSAKAMLRAVA